MGIFSNIRRHAAVAGGNFDAMFKTVNIPPLPAAVAELLAELNRTDPDAARLDGIISAEPELTANVLRTVNSPLFALKHQVQNIRHAISLLGLERIRSLVLAYTMVDVLPSPRLKLFDHEAFWADSLSRSLLARALCQEILPDHQETAFAAALLADVALPVLLSEWCEYYEPVIARWLASQERLSSIEQEVFGWDHAQAGAWILQHWEFPAELVCLVGTHNLSRDRLGELDLLDTAAPVVALAACLPSVLKPVPQQCSRLADKAQVELSCSAGAWTHLVEQVQQEFHTVSRQLRLAPSRTDDLLAQLVQIIPLATAGNQAGDPR